MMGEARNPHFHDFGISGRVHEPQNQYSLSLETPGSFQESRTILVQLFKILCLESSKYQNTCCGALEKARAEKHADRLIDC